MQRNVHLQEILELATDIYEDSDDHEQTALAAGAIRHAILKRLEDPKNLGYSVLVKYGDADAVKDEYGLEDDDVWGVPHPEGYTLFRVEERDHLHVGQVDRMHKQFQAIGAWYIGTTAGRPRPSETHHHYLWPDDHPVTALVPIEE
jgi:hypothetical protein